VETSSVPLASGGGHAAANCNAVDIVEVPGMTRGGASAGSFRPPWGIPTNHPAGDPSILIRARGDKSSLYPQENHFSRFSWGKSGRGQSCDG